MVRLLIATDAPDELSAETRFGGRPLAGDATEFTWPDCAECGGPLQFLGQIAIPSADGRTALLALFMCVSENICATWEPEGGANRAIIMLGDTFVLHAPPVENESTLRETSYGARIEEVAGNDYAEATDVWSEDNGDDEEAGSSVLGQYGGVPEWIQNEETPVCGCGATMTFVAQLNEGPDYRTAMNFGSGDAYVFRCGDHAAAMLWQQ